MLGTRLTAIAGLALPALVVVPGLPAQDAGDAQQVALVEKRDKKLNSEFLKKAGWVTDFDKAKAAAKEAKKLIFGYFTRSYSP